MAKHRKKEHKFVRSQTGIDSQFPKTPIKKEADELMCFSFKYLELTHRDFNLNLVNHEKYHAKLLHRLKDISGWSDTHFACTSSNALRAHKIDWSRPSIQETGFGILDREELDDMAFQFSISANEYGRVMGFLVDNTFFVRWLDPQHQCDVGRPI
ncbi:MAG: hypothetical protein JW947_03690 [Sedimentisphaerales bacterium]|nr:hypothetical protein [Sedimentisphaerales bacterium]